MLSLSTQADDTVPSGKSRIDARANLPVPAQQPPPTWLLVYRYV